QAHGEESARVEGGGVVPGLGGVDAAVTRGPRPAVQCGEQRGRGGDQQGGQGEPGGQPADRGHALGPAEAAGARLRLAAGQRAPGPGGDEERHGEQRVRREPVQVLLGQDRVLVVGAPLVEGAGPVVLPGRRRVGGERAAQPQQRDGGEDGEGGPGGRGGRVRAQQPAQLARGGGGGRGGCGRGGGGRGCGRGGGHAAASVVSGAGEAGVREAGTGRCGDRGEPIGPARAMRGCERNEKRR